MNAIECIGTRRSVREYKNIPVDEETLNTIAIIKAIPLETRIRQKRIRKPQ